MTAQQIDFKTFGHFFLIFCLGLECTFTCLFIFKLRPVNTKITALKGIFHSTLTEEKNTNQKSLSGSSDILEYVEIIGFVPACLSASNYKI